jgi:hypothetical protein
MFKVINAYTYELDNPERAIQDIHDQIDMKNNLLNNTVALLFCHSKFIEMGIMEAVCKSLPFDVLGCTSLFFAQAAADKSVQTGDMMLTVTVLTSDDTEFATGLCEPLSEANAEGCIQALYTNTAALFSEKPELAFAFPPTMLNITIDVILAALDLAGDGLPVFGTVALDMDTHIRQPQTIYNGVAYNNRMPLLLFKGPVKPKFFFIRFPEQSALTQDAVITRAEGPRIFTINNKPAVSFLEGLGLIKSAQGSFSHAIPLVVGDSKGNNPEVVVVLNITPEGALICGRHAPIGGVLNIGAITADYVLESAKTLIRDIKEHGKETGLFIISCFLRSIVLGVGSIAEVELLRQELDSYPDPWLYVNSGGELCPRYTVSGETVNQALQYALVACQF